MFVANWSGPSTAVSTSEVVSTREELEEKPVVLGDGVGVVEDGGPPVEGIEDDFFGERCECEWGPVCAGMASEGADGCCRSQSASTAEILSKPLCALEEKCLPCKSATLFCVIPPVV